MAFICIVLPFLPAAGFTPQQVFTPQQILLQMPDSLMAAGALYGFSYPPRIFCVLISFNLFNHY